MVRMTVRDEHGVDGGYGVGERLLSEIGGHVHKDAFSRNLDQNRRSRPAVLGIAYRLPAHVFFTSGMVRDHAVDRRHAVRCSGP